MRALSVGRSADPRGGQRLDLLGAGVGQEQSAAESERRLPGERAGRERPEDRGLSVEGSAGVDDGELRFGSFALNGLSI